MLCVDLYNIRYLLHQGLRLHLRSHCQMANYLGLKFRYPNHRHYSDLIWHFLEEHTIGCILKRVSKRTILVNHKIPLILVSYVFWSRIESEAASPLSGSVGFGYLSNCGRNTSKMFIKSNIGDHVWLMTSRQTLPDCSSIFGWNILFKNPIEGDLYGYWSGNSTLTFHTPPS